MAHLLCEETRKKLAILLFLFGVSATAHAKELITREEANLPDYLGAAKGLFPGPKVVQLAPAPNAVSTTSPIAFKIRFEMRGSRIDVATVRVMYLKTPSVDLTDRLREYISPNGIDMPQADVPPGNHRIRIEVKDADGLVGESEIMLRVQSLNRL